MDQYPPTTADYAYAASEDAKHDIFVVATALRFMIEGRQDDALKLIASVRRPPLANEVVAEILAKSKKR